MLDTADEYSNPSRRLFRPVPSEAKRYELTRTEIPAQRHGRRYRDHHEKFELHSCSSHEPTVELCRTREANWSALACPVPPCH